MKYHVIYTVGKRVSDKDVEFDTVQQCEAWLDGLGATYYEIGLSNETVTELRMKREMKRKEQLWVRK